MSTTLRNRLELEGYFNIKAIPNRGICALYRFAFTIALVYNIDIDSYEGRYCYSNRSDAEQALKTWDGIEDPQDENWIKHKGNIEYSNINYKKLE